MRGAGITEAELERAGDTVWQCRNNTVEGRLCDVGEFLYECVYDSDVVLLAEMNFRFLSTLAMKSFCES